MLCASFLHTPRPLPACWLSTFLLLATLAPAILVAPQLRADDTPVNLDPQVTTDDLNKRCSLNRRTRLLTCVADIRVRNQSTEHVLSPLHLVFTIDGSGVQMAGASGGIGAAPYGGFYYDLSASLGDGRLSPGETLSFHATFTSAQPFAFETSAYGVLPAANQPPTAVASAIPQSVSLQPGQDEVQVQLDSTGSVDPEQRPLTYQWTGTTTDPDDVAMPVVHLTAGSHIFTLIVLDDQNLPSAPAVVQVDVSPAPNLQPVASATAPASVTLDPFASTVAVVLDGSGSTDPDGSISRYEWTGTPPLDPEDIASPTVFLPEGTHEFRLTVYDDLDTPSTPAPVTVVVNPVPAQHAPELQVSSDTAEVDEGGLLILTLSASDADGDAVTLSASPAIANAGFSSSAGTNAAGTFSFQPDYDQAGLYTVDFVARDRLGLTDRKTVEIQVNNLNRPPTIEVPTSVTVDEGALAVIPITAADPDGDPIQVQATPLPANALLLPVQRTIQLAPDFDQQGTFAIQVSADDGSLSADATTQVTVNDVPTGGGGPRELELIVDPVESPTFLAAARVTGSVNAEPQTAPTTLRSTLITGLGPAGARQGQTLEVAITGQASGPYATHFDAASSAAGFGSGITVTGLTVTGPTAATATIEIGPGARLGTRLVSVTTGAETAVSVVAFDVSAGLTQVTGTLIDEDTGEPIVGAVVTIQGTNLRTQTSADGTFTLAGVPTGDRTLVVNAADHALVRMPLSVAANTEVALGELKTPPTVYDPQAGQAVSVGSLLQRGIADGTRTLSLDQAKAVVQDALLLVGGPDIGIEDAYGNQLNPEVGDTHPFVAFGPDTVETLAERMVTTETRTLGEVLFGFTAMWEWQDGKPVLIEWLNAIQTIVDRAWADPRDRRYALIFLLFNPERGLAPEAPTITADMPLNALQATLVETTLLLSASRHIDPQVLHEGLLTSYPELAGVRFPHREGGLVATLGDRLDALVSVLIPPARASGEPVAAAEQAEHKVYVDTKLMLAARKDVNPPDAVLSYAWTLASRPIPSTKAELTEADERIAYFKPDVSGEYRLQLVVTWDDDQSTPFEVRVIAGDRCDDAFRREWHNADATWEEVYCVLGTRLPKKVAGDFVVQGLDDYFKGANPLSTYNAKISAAHSLQEFINLEGFSTPASKIEAAKVFGEHYPAILKEAQQSTSKFTAFKKFAVNQAINGAASFVLEQTSQIGRDIMYGILDHMIDLYIKSLRPAPPDAVEAQLVEMTGFEDRNGVLITFERSANDLTGKPLPVDDPGNLHIYYILWRSSPGDLMTRLVIGAEGDTMGPFPLPDAPDRLAFLDPDPPEGQNAYYVQTRRIIGAKTVTVENWDEAGFWVEQLINTAAPPQGNVYTHFKAFSDRAIKFLKAIKMQDSDLSLPERIYIPRPFERPAPPISLASTPFFSVYKGDVLLGMPLFNSVFRLEGGQPEYLLSCGFKDPYQVGLAVDSLGYVYADNAASDQLFGGRIFRWKPFDLTRELFGSVQYFSLDLQLARPCAVQSMTAGWLFDSERLFIADAYSDTVRELIIPPSGALPPVPNHYVSQPVTAAGEVPIRADTSMAVDGWNAELLVSSGDNLWRYGAIQRGYLFPDGLKPFSNISGVGVDEIGNLYLADSHLGSLTVIPNLKRNPSFFQRLVSDPATRSLYTLVDGLASPGDLRLAGDQKALVWFDRDGFHQYAFGFSGRLVDLDDNPIPGARVSVENRGTAAEVITNEYGVFRLRGLRGRGLSDQVSLLIRTHDGQTGSYRVNLERIGHSFHERVVFLPTLVPTEVETPLPDDPPAPVDVPPAPVSAGATTLVETPVDTLDLPAPEPVPEDEGPGGIAVFAPYVEILTPADGLKTGAAEVLVRGIVIGTQVQGASLSLNGSGQSLSVTGGSFETTVALREGLNRIQVSVDGIDPNGEPVRAASAPVRVLRGSDDGTGALVGLVTSQSTGYPVPAAEIHLPDLGLSATTDAHGIWRILDVPAGDVEIEVVP
jgi:hypothetical protein